MDPSIRITALKMLLLALDEIQASEGQLPPGDTEAGVNGPETFLDLVKHYAGTRVPVHELTHAIDAVAPLFPNYQFPWK